MFLAKLDPAVPTQAWFPLASSLFSGVARRLAGSWRPTFRQQHSTESQDLNYTSSEAWNLVAFYCCHPRFIFVTTSSYPSVFWLVGSSPSRYLCIVRSSLTQHTLTVWWQGYMFRLWNSHLRAFLIITLLIAEYLCSLVFPVLQNDKITIGN
jgi:hypothetical protein